jgi:hypothetical protein
MGFDGFEDITIDGFGARLIFAGKTKPFSFNNSRSPCVRGVTIDWDRPAFSQGDVVAVTAAGYVVSVRIDTDFPLDGSESSIHLANAAVERVRRRQRRQ